MSEEPAGRGVWLAIIIWGAVIVLAMCGSLAWLVHRWAT